MDFKNSKSPSYGSILSIKFIDILDVVSIPDPDGSGIVDINAIVLMSGKSYHTMEALPNTGVSELASIDEDEGTAENPNIKLKLNNTSKANLNYLKSLVKGRYILIAKDGSGVETLYGTKEQWLSLNYKLDGKASRSTVPLIDVEFSFI